MRKEKEYRERCAARGLDATALDAAVAAVEALEARAREGGAESDVIPLTLVESHIADLVASGGASEERILAFARYFVVLGEDQKAIRLLAYLLPIGVLPAMAGRIAELEGEARRDRIMAHVAIPPAGSPPEAYPAATKAFLAALESELGTERAGRVLKWNVHGIPAAAFAEERDFFLSAPSVDAWLVGQHERQVAVLARHAESGKLWYEQKITPRVVEFVRSNPEICGGRREGRLIYTAKIPYDPDRWLGSTDPVERRRLACHCPFAASTITAAGAGVHAGASAAVSALWCSCSAGYEKVMYDAVFGIETECEVLESVLTGGERCRFAIWIPESVPLFRAAGE
jgi:hypothetical protein